MNVCIVRTVDLPPKVNGATIPDENGDYNIYLNKRLSPEGRIKAYLHELDHISKGHFDSDLKSVAEKEAEIKE